MPTPCLIKYTPYSSYIYQDHMLYNYIHHVQLSIHFINQHPITTLHYTHQYINTILIDISRPYTVTLILNYIYKYINTIFNQIYIISISILTPCLTTYAPYLTKCTPYPSIYQYHFN